MNCVASCRERRGGPALEECFSSRVRSLWVSCSMGPRTQLALDFDKRTERTVCAIDAKCNNATRKWCHTAFAPQGGAQTDQVR